MCLCVWSLDIVDMGDLEVEVEVVVRKGFLGDHVKGDMC